MPSEAVASLDRSTLRERALEALRSAITSGRYRPGDPLREADLATRLGVSRGTVREALRHLQQEGLVTAGARGTLRVHMHSPGEIRELYQVRAALEGLAVTLLTASQQRDTAVKMLREAVAKLDAPYRTLSEHIDADLAFHLLLCELSANSVLVDTWKHLEGRVRITILSDGDENHPQIMSTSHHAPIVDAIEAGDAFQALGVIQQHMAIAADRLASSAE